MCNKLNIMFKSSLFFAAALCLTALSCKKDESEELPSAPESYMNVEAGSSRSYSFQENNPPTPPVNYTLIPAGRDTTVNGKTYKIFINSNGTLEYYNQNGNNYYTLMVAPLGLSEELFENLYLKTDQPVNSSWDNTFSLDAGLPFPISIVLNNKIVEKNVSRTINGNTYNNVIHVKSSISASIGPLPVTGLSSEINNYYAPKYGMVESSNIVGIDFNGLQDSTNNITKLVSATFP